MGTGGPLCAGTSGARHEPQRNRVAKRDRSGAYCLCASAISRLLPEGGKVIDLGAATGRVAAVLSEHRPDAQIVAVDLSEEMVRSGRSALAAQGLSHRVTMKVGDMRSFGELVPDDVAVVASSWALENLPTLSDMDRCLAEIAAVRKCTGCAVWLERRTPRPQPRRVLALAISPSALGARSSTGRCAQAALAAPVTPSRNPHRWCHPARGATTAALKARA